jgi:F-type H+-transporting ATPase subunit delta
MVSGAVTNRYTQGLYQMALAHGLVDVVDDSLSMISTTVKAHADFKSLLEHPLVLPDAKVSAIQGVFGESVDPVVYRFLRLLFHRNRSTYLVSVAHRFHQLSQESKGRVTVEIESAQTMTDDSLAALCSELSAKLKKIVHAEVKVNPALIAGYRVKVGNRVMDATISGALTQFRNRLSSTTSASKEGTR